MRILYLLERPELSGGVRVVFEHAGLLQRAGHEAAVAAHGPLPAWPGYRGRYYDLDQLRPGGSFDLVVATFYTTLEWADRLDLGPVAHFCQGYEGGLLHLQPRLAEIEAVYARPVPTLVVSPHLGELMEQRFGRSWRLAPPALSPPRAPWWRRSAPRRRPWVALSGVRECVSKGIEDGLRALSALRDCRLLRISALPLGPELPAAHRTLVQCRPEEAARALAGCDLLLFPVTAEEGFGLPLLEAMALGVPAVARDGPATRFVSAGQVPLVAGERLGEAARALLADPAPWREVRQRGLERARAFSPEAVVPQLEQALRWATSAFTSP